ncbi:MAG: rod shape-determining protein RodA [Deltaproteobacteria bacterium]|nr:rod shape-determining protein RodA [Deltaproteobacteria bacterium]MBW2445031.1 rod shape-determining protein RodA [Deltaproteobacteria bacterium]
MLRIDRRSAQNFDWLLLGLTVVLVGMGLANLWSATHSGPGGMAPEVRRQLTALAIGTMALVAAVAVDYRHLQRLAMPAYVATLVLLLLTLVLAPVIRGSQGWLVFGPVRIQPSELARVGAVLVLARWFARNPPSQIRQLRELWKPAALLVAPVTLIVLQRDMGVALLTLLVGTTFVVFVRIPARAWAGVAALGVAAFAGLWSFGLRDYQRGRILDFVDPGRDPLSSGYQAIQSTIAVGSGGLFGKGYLEGTQTQLRFLPTQHTDFVFSVLAEEWGLIGSFVVLGLFIALLLWGLVIARNSKDNFGAFLAVGCVALLFWPAAINVAMVLGLAPVIGVPLPLFSYGGSALLANLATIGLLLNVSMRRYMF